jgi:serine/threonine protein kinase
LKKAGYALVLYKSMMHEGKTKQKSLSKPVISKKRLPKEFFEAPVEKIEVKSPTRKGSKETMKLNKVLKHLDKMPDQSTEKLFEPFKPNNVNFHSIKLDEMITLSQVSSSDLSSSVRKVLHCKTLTLFSVKQIPVAKRQERDYLEDSIEKWKALKNPFFVKIIETFRNVPEGCLSIVSEYLNAGSLMDLTRTVATIPEQPLSKIAKFLLEAAQWMEENNARFINLKTSQVLFDRKGNMKLSSGLSRKTSPRKDPESSVSMIGQLLIKAVLDDQFELKQKNCCYFHSIDENMIFSRLSSAFQDFLCGLTSFDRQFSVKKALSHSWLSLEEYPGAAVSLAEIIGIEFKGVECKSDDSLRAGNMQLSRICEALRVVLAGGKFDFPSPAAVESLAKELGVPCEELREQLKVVYREVQN